MTMISCPACGGQDAACGMCFGNGSVSDSGPPRQDFVTERYKVSGAVTDRVIVTWQNGTEHTLYRPAKED